MIELYLHEQTLKMEREMLNQQLARQADRPARRAGGGSTTWPGLRRRLALALLALADRLDPRPIMSAAHRPGRPSLNGTLHRA